MKNKTQSQRERLENVLSTPYQYFANKMQNHLNNKITYLSKLKPNVPTSVHIELLYIAKKRPDTFLKYNEIIKFLTSIVDDRGKEMPKALATTLFMIFGQVYRNQPKPPLIMAKLLLRDVCEAQEFCHFEKAAEFIHRVQLTYFFQPSLLNIETRLALYHQSKPAAEEVPDSYLQWDAESSYEISHVQNDANTEIKAIHDNHPTDSHYADILVFFMTMPKGQDTFITEFNFLCETFPEYIPKMFNSVQFFLTHANASDSVASEFAKQFAQLNPTICVDEYQETLAKIIDSNQQYFPFISAAKLSLNLKRDNMILTQTPGLTAVRSENSIMMQGAPQIQTANYSYPNSVQVHPAFINASGSRNLNDPTVEYIVQAAYEIPDDNISDVLRKLEDHVRNLKPPLNITCDVLSKFLNYQGKLTIDSVSRIILIFDIFFKHTLFQNPFQLQPKKQNSQQKQQQQQQQQCPKICELISLFVAKISKTSFLKALSKSLTNIVVPVALKNEGIPFKQEALAPFTSNSELHQIAYAMIYSAAKYQAKHDPAFPAVLGPPTPTICKSICAFCESPKLSDAAKAFALACLLIVISPNEIGASIYQYDEKLRKIFIQLFLLHFIGRTNEADKLLDDIKFDDPISTKKDMKNFIGKLANLKYLSPDPLLHCTAPNYLDDLLKNEEKFSAIPKYITRITKEMIESISFVGLTKYIFFSLIAITKSRNNITAPEIYVQLNVHEWVELLYKKHCSSQERSNMLIYIAKNLENEDRNLRVSAYVMILILNAEIIKGISSELSYDSSGIVSRENSSTSIPPASSTTATTVCVPVSCNSNSSISSLAGSFILFKFDLPDNEDTVGIISRSLYIDNEVEIAKSFVTFLAHSQFSGNALSEFVEKRPLLANCLQEPSLSKLLKNKYSYDGFYTPNFNYPNFRSALSLNSQVNQRSEYHDAFAIHPKLIDLSLLPTSDDPTVIDSKYVINNLLNNQDISDNPENSDDDNESSNKSDFVEKFECKKEIEVSNLNPFESSQLEREVYRYEIILSFNREESMKSLFFEDHIQWFALASLKRYVLCHKEAFLLYARPTLNVLYSEIKHANFLTKIMINRFISFLSICYLKLINQRNILDEKEQDFLHNSLIPKLEEISNFETIKQYNDLPQIVPVLLNGIIGSFKDTLFSSLNMNLNSHNNLPTKSSKNINNNSIASFILPSGIPFEMIISTNERDISIGIQQSLILTTDDYASKLLLNIAVQSPSLITNTKNDFQKNVILPLILSSNKDTVVDFFRLMKEEFPEETQDLMDSIAKIVNSVYEAVVNPKNIKKKKTSGK